MMTPEQFSNLVTKDDLIKALENKADKQDIGKMLTILDAINKTLGIHEVEKVANIAAHDRMQTTLNKHERRITKLETVKIAI